MQRLAITGVAGLLALAHGLLLTAPSGVLEAGNSPAAQVQHLCGQGVLIRNNNVVIIDRWTGWDLPQAGGAVPPQPKQSTGPSRIVLGEAIEGGTPICVESPEGSTCIPLGELRALVAKRKR